MPNAADGRRHDIAGAAPRWRPRHSDLGVKRARSAGMRAVPRSASCTRLSFRVEDGTITDGEVTVYIADLKISGVRGFSGPRSADLRLTRPDGSHAGWTVLAGRNGSGKTTLLRALALAMAGPSTARSLVPSFDGWISNDLSDATVEVKIAF